MALLFSWRQRLRIKKEWAPLEKPWSYLLSEYCAFVAWHPFPFIALPILLTLVLSTGILVNFKIVRGVHFLYAPMDAEWKAEEDIFEKLWSPGNRQFYPGKDVLRRKGIYLMMTSKDGGSVLRRDHSKDFLKLLDWVEHTSFLAENGSSFTYQDTCLHFRNACFDNTHARIVAQSFIDGSHSDMNISFPLFHSQFSAEPIDLSHTLGSVLVDPSGKLLSAATWVVLYQLRQETQELRELSSTFERSIEAVVRAGALPSHLLSVFHFHSNTFDDELADSNRRLIPRFSVTFTILIIFSIACTFTLVPVMRDGKQKFVVDWVMSKPFMGIVGVITTMMAIISAMGLLLLFNVTFVDMCTVMPFLSLTIGIDDTFLMLAAWHDTPRTLSVERRIRRAMRHAAVSISITSLTDSLAFLIGAIAPLPAVKYFCFYSAAAIAFIFAYSMSIFVAVLALQGRREERGENSLTGRATADPLRTEKLSSLALHFGVGSRSESGAIRSEYHKNTTMTAADYFHGKPLIQDSRLWYQRMFEESYAPFIWMKEVQVFAALLYAVFVAVTVLGVQRLVVGFDLINIIQSDSPAYKFLKIKAEQFPETMERLEVAVMHPPHMALPGDRKKFMDILNEFETTTCSLGRSSTDFWYFGYQEYINELGFGDLWAEMENDKEGFDENLEPFLMNSDKYAYDVLRSNGSMNAFRLSTGLTSLSSSSDYRIVECCEIMRNLARKHSSYNISTYTPLWNLADQFEIMWPQTMQDIYISILVMIPISLLFIGPPLCAVMISLNILSVGFGVIGWMALWGVNLDATSMITIAMSVGFSVDFAAHVTYAYISETGSKDGQELLGFSRLAATLGIVGWPVAQASSSVLLGISTLATVDSYVVQTCFKTVFLVVVFGSLHALLFLPLLLTHSHTLVRSLWNGRNFYVVNPKQQESHDSKISGDDLRF